MNRCLPILILWSLIACIPALKGQEADSLASDSILIPAPISQSISLEIPRIGMDTRLNDGFAPFGNGVGNVIFYAPVIAEDILYAQQGVPRSEEDFYDTPPFTVSYKATEGNSPDFGTIYSVYQGEAGTPTLSYRLTKKIPLDQEVEIEGIRLTVTKESYDAEGDVLQFSVVSSEALEGFEFQVPAIDEGVSEAEIRELSVNYPRLVPFQPGQSFTENGMEITLTPNEASNYSLNSGTGYTFQLVEVSFLPFIIIFLILGATFFTLYFRFINFRKFKLAIDVVRGKYSKPGETGEVSHFQALTAALSGTVGLGNIAGVAIAISIGGAGATFWMIIAGLIGMSSKFVECTLAVKYRKINDRGVVSGGPMYYLSQGLAAKGYAGLGKIAAVIFSVMCIGGSFGGGNMFQVNQAFQQFQLVTGGENSFIAGNAWLFGLVMAGLVALVIIGGIKGIASVTDKIVPFMCGVYALAALIIIGMNYTEVPRVFGEIFSHAFSPLAVGGGLIGVLIQGFRRAAFSNEAGVGSAPIAHAAVKTNYPASEGLVALLEPFIDTVVVCTLTALVIIITDNHLDPNASDGVALTSSAFSSQIPFFDYVLAIAVILFAFSTMITWSYYGLKAWTYLFGDNRLMDTLYKLLFCIFIIIGSAATLTSVTDFSDAMIFAMSVPNVIGMIILIPEVRAELQRYQEKISTFVAGE